MVWINSVSGPRQISLGASDGNPCLEHPAVATRGGLTCNRRRFRSSRGLRAVAVRKPTAAATMPSSPSCSASSRHGSRNASSPLGPAC